MHLKPHTTVTVFQTVVLFESGGAILAMPLVMLGDDGRCYCQAHSNFCPTDKQWSMLL
jgi:hypothetical protein